jgi:hypothetical protein
MNREICTSCENYFWINQLSLLPNDWLRTDQRKYYCPRCYPEILEEQTKLLYYEF